MHSCIYEGTVTHSRRSPIDHRFRYAVRWVYLDLEEVPDLLGKLRLLSDRKFHTYSFLPSDHMERSIGDLRTEVLSRVQLASGETPSGPVRLLTPLRQFGFYFSPISLFFCWGHTPDLHSIVAEVNNTPWRERHWYVLNENNRLDGSGLRYQHHKQFHVSPFMDMDSTYRWQLSEPGEQLNVSMMVSREKQPFFTAGMDLRRRPLTDHALSISLIRFPVASLQMLGAIYFEALRLWKKKCPFYAHPSKRTDKPTTVTA